jgi:hypothetical protein
MIATFVFFSVRFADDKKLSELRFGEPWAGSETSPKSCNRHAEKIRHWFLGIRRSTSPMRGLLVAVFT